MFRTSGVAFALLFSTSALAADLPYRKAADAVFHEPYAHDWSGFYVGAHAGFGHGRAGITDPAAPGSVDVNTKGFVGGGQIGFNYQRGGWVVGVEADYSGSAVDGNTTMVDPTGDVLAFDSRVRWTSLVTARVGHAFGPWLAYVRGGAAFGGTRETATEPATGASASGRANRSGWIAGAGLEYAIAPGWSVRTQYDYVDFGTATVTLTDNVGDTGAGRFKTHIHQVKLGLNLHFGP